MRKKKSDMKLLKVLSCSLMFIATISFVDGHLSENNTLPKHYNIEFTLYNDENIFYGEYNVSIYSPHKAQEIYVYTENLNITEISMTNKIFKENKGEDFTYKPNVFFVYNEVYVIIIPIPYNVDNFLGLYNLNMKFKGSLAENGGFRTFYMNQQNSKIWIAATHYDSKFATRKLFPLLWNTIYASYNISVKHHKNYTALSNMPVRAVKTAGNNMQWTRFKPTPVMPVYFIALIVGDFTLISETNQSVKMWCRTGMLPRVQFAYTVAKNVTLFLENKLPDIRITSDINHVAIPNLLTEEEIKLGFILYREADIIFDKEMDTEARKIEITRLIGYRVIHEWFYNKINLSEWQPWIHKGFAMFFGICVIDKSFPHLGIQDFFVVQMQHELLHWYTEGIWPLNSGVNSSIEIPRYIKASIVFRTLQNALTEEAFWNGFKVFLRLPYVNSNDFWDIMQYVMDTSSSKIKYHLKNKITNWTQLNHYPVVNVKLNYDTNSFTIFVQNFINIAIYVNITTLTYTNLNKTFPAFWIVPHTLYELPSKSLGNNDWVLINLQQSECYRVNYDAENWKKLSDYLNSNSFERIHVLDRAKIIDDTFHLMMTGQLNSTVFFNISFYLRQDTDYVAWYSMFKVLEYMSGFFAFPESAPVKITLTYPLSEILRKIKFPDFAIGKMIQGSVFIKRLREEAARWLCILNYEYCFSKANYELISYLLNLNTSSPCKIWTGWKEWTFCNGLMRAGEDTWLQMFNIYSKKSDYNVLKFLACSKMSRIVKQNIKLITSDKIITDFDRINSFYSIVARHANNIQILDFMLYNLEEIKPKQINGITALNVIINHVYSKQRINEIQKYVKNKIEYILMYPAPPVINYKHNDTDEVIKSMPFDENMESLIIYVNYKIESRWYQIKTQLHEYRYLIKDFDGIPKAAWVNQFGEFN